ncbi:MAG TPA: AraC family transcriptional regulator ligand-binding domain-containing protein [Candidatus Kapabacteria bacterium]|nr:AraC family transcriptional regulator ligand-binding domain-containing protein [Candidatus Kapabacteria bacterium]
MQKITSPGRFLTFGAYPRKFVQLLESEWQIPAEPLLAGTGLDRQQLDDPELLVPFADVVTIFRNGVGRCPAPDLALRYASQLRPSSHGLLGAAVLTGGSLQDAIDLFYDYVGLVAPFLLLHQEDRRNSRVLVFEMISDVQVSATFTYDIMLLSTFNILKLILGERTRELVFHFAHPAPAHAAIYDTYFDGHVQFNASFYGVSIPRDLLNSRVSTADDDTHRLLVSQISSRMEMVHTQNSFVDAVRFHLKRTEGPLPRMSTVAEAFNMSARTFRNRLRRHNTSYQSLLDRERHEQAMNFLRNSEKSVKEIAYILGFQESSNFSRVFKKWTGVTPLDFRRNTVSL